MQEETHVKHYFAHNAYFDNSRIFSTTVINQLIQYIIMFIINYARYELFIRSLICFNKILISQEGKVILPEF